MSEEALKKIAGPKAEAYCADLELDEAALALLTPELTPAQYLDRLIEARHHNDAVYFLARALPKREATWWACLAARGSLGEKPRPEWLKALAAAEQWVYKPSEENRRACQSAAEAAGFDHPASWAAMAAFWSTGSMAPPGLPAVPPAEGFTGKAASGAVILSAVLAEPEKAPEKLALSLRQGIDIAKGGDGRKITANPNT